MKKFEESKHPRGKGGKFAPKGTQYLKVSEEQKTRLKAALGKKASVSKETKSKSTVPKETKGKATKSKKTTIALPTSAELGKMKVTELTVLATKLGLEHPAKYKNRKVSWTSIIEKYRESTTTPKAKAEPKVSGASKTKVTKGQKTATPQGVHAPSTLSKYKLSTLKGLAKELGAPEPTSNAHRKDPWIQSILGHLSKTKAAKEETKVTKEPVATRATKVTKEQSKETKKQSGGSPGTPTHTSLIQSGESLTGSIGIKDSKTSEHLKVAQDKLVDLAQRFHLMSRDQKATAAAKKKLQTEGIALQDKIQHLQKKLDEEGVYRQHEKVLTAIKEHHKVSNKELDRLVSRVPIKLDDGFDKGLTEDHLRDVVKLTGGKLDTLKVIMRTDPRAYANMQGEVNIGKDVRAHAIYHELGHHVEYSRPELMQASFQFLSSRATGQPSVAHNGEEYVPDHFVNSYVGRIYRDTQGRIAPTSEVISVGLEHFSDPKRMHDLWTRDREHYHFIVGVLTHK